MLSDASNHELLAAWKNGDQDAASILFARYQVRMMALVRSRLSRKLARRVDTEDIVLSAYRSFFVAARDGRSTAGADDDLWPLLTTFALRKLTRQARRHTAGRRSIDREQFEDSMLEFIGSHEPDAEQAVVLSDEVEHLLSQLDPTAQEVLVRTLQGDDAVTIAAALGLHERTVRRAVERIREQLPVEETALFKGSMNRQVRPSNRPRSIREGTVTYDEFLLQQFIGAGAFSKVYRAIEKNSGEVVAIKFLRKECWQDERATASLIREYDLLTQLQHRQILRMRGWGMTPRGALFLVTDFIAGRNLADWSKAHSPPLRWIVETVATVADAVAVAHARGILHCDLKPSNVLVRDNGEVVLCDFGLARHAADPGDVPRGGTAGFLSPEQISDAFGSISERTDVYGLGALCYTLLTGLPPMQGRDLPETLANVLSLATPPAPSAVTESTPQLDAIVLRCLQKEPGSRYATVSEVAAAIKSLPVLQQ